LYFFERVGEKVEDPTIRWAHLLEDEFGDGLLPVAFLEMLLLHLEEG
jgi:hypothetical protein